MTAKRKPAPRVIHAIVEPDGHVPCLSLAGNNVAEPGDRVVLYVRRDILDRALRELDEASTHITSETGAKCRAQRRARNEVDAIRKLIAEETKT